ncbi:unnamed protein product [Caenorhabditis angaria]|uniref:Uncharacterized protein n=1 Tax=Caenorhabditis angaria TaxID=860376 RepID=A0A9P1ITI8_9PELO|nr:unnamed protein product [Caenorhabditis angaria]
MIKPILCIFLIISPIFSEKTKQYVGLSSEDETTKKYQTLKLHISKETDFDFDQLTDVPKVEKVLTAGPEYVTETETADPETLKDAIDTYQKGLSFIERGKGHGRDGKLAAHRLFKLASDSGHLESAKLTAFANLFGDYARWSVEDAKKVFRKLAAQGSADANFALGFMHATGIGMKNPDEAKAFLYYLFSAQGGSPFGQMAIGYRHLFGVGVPQNCESALSYYQRVAKKVADEVTFTTNPATQRLRLNDEVDPTVNLPSGTAPIDPNLLDYYSMMAEKGDATTQLGLGQLYLYGGRGVTQDFLLAYKYLALAAEHGSSDGYALIGKMYLDGVFDKGTDENAFDFLQKAVDKGNSAAQATLGVMYLKGRGVYRNYDKAYKLLTMAADKKHVDGQLYLGEMYYKGIPTQEGVKRDFAKALKLFQLAAQNGHVLGLYNLAQMYSTGTGVSRSCSHATDFFKNVAERGKWTTRLTDAYNAYKEGRHDEAAIVYAFMAELGYEAAQSNLAHILDRQEANALFSEDVEKRYGRAIVNWQRSANQEYSIARLRLGNYYYYGHGVPIDHNLAFNHYKTAVDRHALPQAMFNLGYMYETGKGITKDLHLAKRYYDQSIEHSLDSYLPSKLALTKLAFVFLLEEINKNHVIMYFEELVGPHWDIIFIATIIGGLIYFLPIEFDIYEQRNIPNVFFV